MNFVGNYTKSDCISMIQSLMNNDILNQIECSNPKLNHIVELDKYKNILSENDNNKFFDEYYEILFKLQHSKNKEKEIQQNKK